MGPPSHLIGRQFEVFEWPQVPEIKQVRQEALPGRRKEQGPKSEGKFPVHHVSQHSRAQEKRSTRTSMELKAKRGWKEFLQKAALHPALKHE